LRTQHKVPGTVSELLSFDAEMKRQNEVLKVRAEQARAAAVAVIAQVVEVQVSSVPLLKGKRCAVPTLARPVRAAIVCWHGARSDYP
jgi:hypothetical protein